MLTSSKELASPTMLKTLIIYSLLISCAFVPSLRAQTAYKASSKSATMTLYGTSTLHDWTMTATVFTADGQFTVTPDNQLTALNALTVTLPVHNLKSEHDGMNDNAYDALKADQNKNITFQLKSATVTASGGNKYQIAALGSLSIAGVSKAVTLNTAAVVNADGSISCAGTVPIKLSEFNIERPSFMLGTMKVGDALTLNYTLIFVK
jgi:polyisoprenoid-binding protein YceI